MRPHVGGPVGVGTVPGQVVGEVVVADPDPVHVTGRVLQAQRVVLQVDGGLAVVQRVFDVGQGGQGGAEAGDVVVGLEHCPAVHQQHPCLTQPPQDPEREVVAEPGDGELPIGGPPRP